jgi:hypothetical protein
MTDHEVMVFQKEKKRKRKKERTLNPNWKAENLRCYPEALSLTTQMAAMWTSP